MDKSESDYYESKKCEHCGIEPMFHSKNICTKPDMDKAVIEANKVLSEYMYPHLMEGTIPLSHFVDWDEFTSIDGQIPVMKKYLDEKFGSKTNNKFMLPMLVEEIQKDIHSLMYNYGHTYEEASCIAVAKKIIEFKTKVVKSD